MCIDDLTATVQQLTIDKPERLSDRLEYIVRSSLLLSERFVANSSLFVLADASSELHATAEHHISPCLRSIPP